MVGKFDLNLLISDPINFETTEDLNKELKTHSETIHAIIAGCLIAFISFGFPASFGMFLRTMSDDLGWAREIFSL